MSSKYIIPVELSSSKTQVFQPVSIHPRIQSHIATHGLSGHHSLHNQGDKTQPVVLLWLSRSETILPPLIGSHCSSTDIVAAPHEGVNDLWWNSIALRYLHSESLCTMSTTFLAVDDIIQMFSDIKSSSAICLRVAVCTAARLLCNYTCV